MTPNQRLSLARTVGLPLLLSLTALASHAQSTPSAAPAAAAASSPAKKELIQRVLKLQQGGIERLATAMTEEPAVLLADRASEIIAAKVPKDRQETVAKEVQSELQKYLKDTVPLVRRSAQQLAPATIGAVLESKFNEDELREIVAMLESPAYGKYQQLSGEMQQSLQARLVSDTRATVEPRVQALEKTLGERLKAATSAAAATPAKPVAKPAAK
ncbi:hypothetical protein [Hydrogenophaga pseudoflava]|uniref:hypothetical protein n=1 Tax=Hydrogenophaga pseudoflava TaxID=47421 RepID=UPI000AE25372|nr:hypothetical protein [Hydrogenophaga pseudoflava]